MKNWFLTKILRMQVLKITSFNKTIIAYTWDEVV